MRLIEVFDGIKVKRGIGRPRELYADSAYDSGRIRAYLRGIKANIPLNPRNRRKPKRGRPCRFWGGRQPA